MPVPRPHSCSTSPASAGVLMIPEPVSRNFSLGLVSRNRRMKPRVRGIRTRQEFIANKHRLPAQEGDSNGPKAFCSSPSYWLMACSVSICATILVSKHLFFCYPSCFLQNTFFCFVSASSTIPPSYSPHPIWLILF